MTDKQTFILINDRVRKNAAEALREADDNSRVVIAPPQRTVDQNAKLHAVLGDIVACRRHWWGKERDIDEWKAIMVSAHRVATAEDPENARAEVVEGIEGEVVQLRESTASMSVARASSLIEYVIAWCVTNGIELHETRRRGFLDERRAA